MTLSWAPLTMRGDCHPQRTTVPALLERKIVDGLVDYIGDRKTID